MENEIIENVNANKDMILCVNPSKNGQRDKLSKLLDSLNINYETLFIDKIGNYELNNTNKNTFIKSIQQYKNQGRKTVYMDITSGSLEESALPHYKFIVEELKKSNLQVLIAMDDKILNGTDSVAHFFSSTTDLVKKLEDVVLGVEFSKHLKHTI